MTKGILKSIKQKNVLYRKFIRTKDLTKKELLLQNFKVYKNTIHKLTRINKSDYYKPYFEEHKNNSKNTWYGIKSIISLKTNSLKQIRSINTNNKTESNPKIMSETFNNFFVTIAIFIDSKIIHTNTSYKNYLQESLLNSFLLKPATKKDVVSVINEMKTNKSAGFTASSRKTLSFLSDNMVFVTNYPLIMLLLI